MKQIDLDDLPPRVAHILGSLGDGEEVVLVRGGVVVGRLQNDQTITPPPHEIIEGLPPEDQVSEILSHFNSMINDEF